MSSRPRVDPRNTRGLDRTLSFPGDSSKMRAGSGKKGVERNSSRVQNGWGWKFNKLAGHRLARGKKAAASVCVCVCVCVRSVV